eukprot:CAMPEP_0202347392 /NCGR_PEP_ID=MMETSP1126-20121109/5773_1 /ASSEMBLY_ACC=CAM_ASM_000457 /TAXON_ID=3047 /ORGANISM="Dunaliella tertiolecta, Strain CCMP1320" /LENGTH=244 /DNA_ID=CAMNT_0048938935 /DNA_START=63 /DNA_END=794 /DNA_ORIENTATION=+
MSDDGVPMRKLRLHKRPASAAASSSSQQEPGDGPSSSAALSSRVSELIPGIADLSLSSAEQGSGPLDVASAVVQRHQARERARRDDLAEMAHIYDMGVPHPLDTKYDASKPWSQSLRPPPRKVQLSQYQTEMINYQRMLLRNNRWYYRDRVNNPRGPCPLHVLKDCWVQGVIDENTLVWGQGLYDWLPAKNVKLLLPMIRTPEVRLGAWMKRTFSLKPALSSIRERRQRAGTTDPSARTMQVEW